MIDWMMVTNNLRRNYKNLTAISREIGGTDWAHLNRLARGEVKEPKFGVGMKLLDLHYDHCKESHDKIKLGRLA